MQLFAIISFGLFFVAVGYVWARLIVSAHARDQEALARVSLEAEKQPEAPWCYRRSVDDEIAAGPYESREEAIERAKACGHQSILLGRVHYLTERELSIDLTDLEERFECDLCDRYHVDEPHVRVVNTHAARAMLDEWISMFVVVDDPAWVGIEEETVHLVE